MQRFALPLFQGSELRGNCAQGLRRLASECLFRCRRIELFEVLVVESADLGKFSECPRPFALCLADCNQVITDLDIDPALLEVRGKQDREMLQVTFLDVLLVHPLQFFGIETRWRTIDILEIEQPDHLLGTEELLVTV